MAARDVERDREAEADAAAAGLERARRVEAGEGLQRPGAVGLGDARAVVLDDEGQPLRGQPDGQRHPARRGARRCRRGSAPPARPRRGASRRGGRRGVSLTSRSADRRRRRGGRPRRCRRRARRDRSATVSSRLSPRAKARNSPSIRSIWSASCAQVAGLLALLHQRQRQLHPGERRAQVVADAGEHLGALLDLALQPRAHRQERGAGAADLLGAGRAERQRAALAEGLGRLGERADRADLVAQEDHRDRGQQQRGERSSAPGAGAGSRPTAGRAAPSASQHAEAGLRCAIAPRAGRRRGRSRSGRSSARCRVATTVPPVTSRKLAVDARASSVAPGLEPQAEVERQRQLGDAQAPRGPGVAGGLDLLDAVGELVGDVAGHLLGDPLVVALEEHQADDQLQHDDRHE